MTRIQRRSRAAVAGAFLLTASLIGGSAPASATSATAPIAARALREASTKGADAVAYVILREQATLDRAFSIADWDARGQFVYDELTRTAARTQAGLLRSLAARGIRATPFWIVNAVALHGADAATLHAVAARAEVARIEADPTAYIEPDAGPGGMAEAAAAPGTSARPDAGGGATTLATEWGISETRAPSVWSGYGVRGEGIVVGTIDTGVLHTHPALVASYRGNTGGGTFNHDYDWFDGVGGCTGAPCDGNGHGTHTMGTIVGLDGSNAIGMAPKARWIAARGCGTSSCSSTALLNSGQWMLAPTPIGGKSGQPSLRPQLVSNSWGSNDGASTTYRTMVANWVAAGIVPVFANGNNGSSCSTVGSPGSYLDAYGVGAYDAGGGIASFSSRGPSPLSSEIKPDISAPGVNVRSAWNNGGYNTISGTSMATPHVAGAIALVLSAAPSLVGQVGAIRGYLDGSARSVSSTQCGGSAGDNNVWGRGKLDAYAAVTAAPRGAAGTLGGTVKVAGSTSAIAGATVAATAGSVTRTTTTDTQGAFSLTLPVGTYAVKVSRFGYSDGTASPTIAEGATTSLAFSLGTLPSYPLTGTALTSGGTAVAGASVQISAPLAPVTTGSSGSFSFGSVPSGTYSLTATAVDPCLAPTTTSVTVGTAAASAAMSLPVRTDAGGHYCAVEPSAGLTGGTSRSGLAGDDAYATFALPWQFSWYGTRYSSLYVSTNGFASFTPLTSSHYVNGTLPSTTAPNGLYPFWADLVVDSNAGVYVQTTGTAGSRRHVVEWRNVAFYGSSTRVTFALVLEEATGNVAFQYSKLGTGAAQLGATASVGIERADGKDGLQYSYRTASLVDGKAIVWRTR